MIKINYGIGVNTQTLGSTFCNRFQKSLDKFVTKYFKKTHIKDFNTVFTIALPGVGFPLCQIEGGKTPLSSRGKKTTKKVVRKRNTSQINHLVQKRDKNGRFLPKKVVKKCKRSR